MSILILTNIKIGNEKYHVECPSQSVSSGLSITFWDIFLNELVGSLCQYHPPSCHRSSLAEIFAL